LYVARDLHLASGVAGLLVAAIALNLVLGQFKLGFRPQPIAHSAYFWSFLGMSLAGLAFTLAGGCPGRQLFMAGEGDGDAGIFALGMLAAGGLAHNFGLASVPDKMVAGTLQVGGPSGAGQVAVALSLLICIALGFLMRERWQPKQGGER
jgi:YedE family putative selenium metabolism protein